MCLFKVLKANRVNLGHTSFVGVLMGAEPKSSVCPVGVAFVMMEDGHG